MSWNYRVMRRYYPEGEPLEPYAFGIFEVYYDEKGGVKGWTVDEMDPHGDTLKELQADFAHMQKAFTAPILDYETGKPIEERAQVKERLRKKGGMVSGIRSGVSHSSSKTRTGTSRPHYDKRGELSDCCGKLVKLSDPSPDFLGDDPKKMKIGTCHYICSKCGCACDILVGKSSGKV